MIFSECIFKPDFDLDGPHVVEASAGTGKTYNIQNICARLVVEKGYRISNIYVMTFTEAATKELRDRVYKILTGFSKYLEGGVDDGDRYSKLAECARVNLGDEWKKIAKLRLSLALTEFDSAAISTIHGFCKRVLSSYAFETNTLFGVELLEKSDEIDNLVKDWLRRQSDDGNSRLKLHVLSPLKVLSNMVKTLVKKPLSKKNFEGNSRNAYEYLFSIASEITNKYIEERKERLSYTYDELLYSVKEALDSENGEELADYLRSEIKAILVDEFQDTDPVQYAIFRKLFLDKECTNSLFFVGDPKQAIYAFRGGDIYTYRSALKRVDSTNRKYVLDTNHRSTPRLVEAINELFADENGEGSTFSFGAEHDTTIVYDGELKYSELKDDVERRPYVVNGESEKQPLIMVECKDSKSRDNILVREILKTLNDKENDIKPGDIAILVKGHKNAKEIKALLDKYNIPVVLQNSGNIFQQKLTNDFKTILKAMALEGGNKQVYSALLTNFFDISASEIEDKESPLIADALSLFKDINKDWHRKGFSYAFSKLLSSDLCRIKERISQLEDGERYLADLSQLQDEMLKAERENGGSPSSQIKWLEDKINSAEDSDKENLRNLESDSDAIKIMTMYISKGLEFPIVFVILPLKDPPSKGDLLCSYHNEDGDVVFSLISDEESKAKSIVESNAENIRLLYVALTRAKKRCTALGKGLESWKLDYFFDRAFILSEEEDSKIQYINSQDEGVCSEELQPYVAPFISMKCINEIPQARAFPYEMSVGSYSNLAPTAHIRDEILDEDGRDYDLDDTSISNLQVSNDSYSIFNLKCGAAIGTWWHAIFEKISFSYGKNDIRNEVVKQAALLGLSEYTDPSSSDVYSVMKMVSKNLDFNLTSPIGEVFRLRDVADEKRLNEWEFSFSARETCKNTDSIRDVLSKYYDELGWSLFTRAMGNWEIDMPKGIIKGFVDLLFVHNGYYYIVDWKSNILEGSGSFTKERVYQEMADSGYFFQYMLYSAVLHKYLKERLGREYSWENNFGGIRYYFLRGVCDGSKDAVFSDRPSEKLLDELCDCLGL